MRRTSVTTVFIAIFVFSTSIIFAQSASNIALPPDTNIIPPGPEVSKELAAFSGKWYGVWYGKRTGAYMGEYVLVVEEITSLSVKVISAGITRRGVAYATRYTAKIVDGSLVFVNKSGATISHRADKDGKLRGEYSSPGGQNVSMLVEKIK